MAAEQTILLMTPAAQLEEAKAPGLPLGVMGYRLSEDGRLLVSRGLGGHQGGWLAVDDRGFSGTSAPSSSGFVQDVLQECAARNYAGVIANWEGNSPALHGLTAALAQALAARGMDFLVPEFFAPDAPQGYTVLSTHLFHGELSRQIRELMDRQKGRVALAIERRAREFLLPDDKAGTPLTAAQLAQRRESYHPAVYFSNELCAHYFSWRGQNGQLRQVIFDTENSLRRQVLLARQLGLPYCLLAWPEVKGLLPRLLQ